jgi:CzcA family heavy metal efflux pump
MFRYLIESCLRFRVVVLAAAAALMVFGVLRLRDMPVDVFPEFQPPLVEVQTEALGLSAEEVESLITINLEELLSGTSWLQSITSQSLTGLSRVLMIFEPGTDVMRARQLVQERLAISYTLPNVSKAPVMIQPLSATSRLMIIGLSSKTASPMQLSVFARWTIRPKLLGVPGVANVAVWGSRIRQLQVHIDPWKLDDYGVTQEQIIAATGDTLWVSPLSFLKSSFPGSGGWIDGPNQRLQVQHMLPISTPEQLAQVPVKTREGLAPLRLADVAKVVDEHPPLIGDAIVDGGPGLLLVVEKLPGANTLQVTRAMDQALAELRLGFPGVEIDSSLFRLANYIEGSIGNWTTALIIGAVLVVLLLAAVLFEWRFVLISAIAIPLSLVGAAVVLYLHGATFNTMVLAGFVVALGAVIDDAIVYADNIMRRLRQRSSSGGSQSIASSVLEAAVEVPPPLVYATLILMLVVAPIFFLSGVAGAFLKPLAGAYLLALLVSLLVAVTLTPVLALTFTNPARSTPQESRLASGLQRGYRAILSWTLRIPRTCVIAAGIAAVFALAAWPRLQQVLIPAFKERDFLVHWTTPPGTSHPEMQRITAQVARELQSIPGIRKVSAHIGRAITGDQLVNINSGQIWINIQPDADYDATLTAIQRTIHGYPGVQSDVETYLRERVRQALTGTTRPIVVRIFGADRRILREQAENVQKALAGIEGIVDLEVEGQVEEPYIQVRLDLEKAGRLGLKPGDVRRAAATVFSGLEVGYLYEEQKIFEVVVWGASDARRNLTNIRNLLLETPTTVPVRLGDVADVRIRPTPTTIRRNAISNYVDVAASVRGRDIPSTVAEVERRLQQIRFPLEYHAELLGEYAERQSAQTRAVVVTATAAIAIFLLLQAAFGSWSLAAASFCLLPIALVGGVAAAHLSGGVISLGSLVGFLAVLGLSARNGLLLIDYYRRLEQQGQAFGLDLVLRGTPDRLMPILLTAIATGLALYPLVYFGDIAGLEIASPMAVVILGGLVSSTLLTLFVVPAMYLVFGPSLDPKLSAVHST